MIDSAVYNDSVTHNWSVGQMKSWLLSNYTRVKNDVSQKHYMKSWKTTEMMKSKDKFLVKIYYIGQYF